MIHKSLHKVGPYGRPSHMYASLYNERLRYDIWNIVTQRVLTRVFLVYGVGFLPRGNMEPMRWSTMGDYAMMYEILLHHES
jgi:hypothetical protein